MTTAAGELTADRFRPAPNTTFRRRLHERRFWVVQTLVLLVIVVHAMVEEVESFTGQDLAGAYFSLYFIPVLYASLEFGREGAIPTALWTGILTVPDILLLHSTSEWIGEIAWAIVILFIAVIVAGRVDRERAARKRAEAEQLGRQTSEARYQGLFESAAEPILILDADGIVEEGNSAAGALLDRPAGGLRGLDLTAFVEPQAVAALLRLIRGERSGHQEVAVGAAGRRWTWVEPVCSAFTDAGGRVRIQAIFRDVTERRERQRGLESYAQQMQRVQEDERLHIARELHDGSVQSLVGLCRRLDALEEATEGESFSEVRTSIRHAREVAEEVAGELRRFSRDLRPSILDDLGLVPAVRWILTEMQQRTGIQGTLTVEGPEERVHPDIELCLFRIAQEALRNVERHAGSASVSLRLSWGDALRLDIVDSGRGFDAARDSDPRASNHLGLLGMRERARLLGGDLRVISAVGAGTRVEASIPARRRWTVPRAPETP